MASEIMSQEAPPLPKRNPPSKNTAHGESRSSSIQSRPLPNLPNNATLPNGKNSSRGTNPKPNTQMSFDASISNYSNITPHLANITVQSSEPPPLPQRNAMNRSASSAEKAFRHPSLSPAATSPSHLVPESSHREAPPPPSLATLPRRKDQDGKDEMEFRFRFHSVEDFPKPEPMQTEVVKTYPSHKASNDSSSSKGTKQKRSPRQPLPAL